MIISKKVMNTILKLLVYYYVIATPVLNILF